MTNYVKLYISEYGELPTDEFGRKFEIHHIDGDHSNNHIENLKAVSIKEHFDIHWEQGDFNACLAISMRMSESPVSKSQVATLANYKRVEAGIHPFQGPELQRKRMAAGDHPLIGNSRKRIQNGTHNFITEKCCPHCGKVGKGGGMYRYHFDKCKMKEHNG